MYAKCISNILRTRDGLRRGWRPMHSPFGALLSGESEHVSQIRSEFLLLRVRNDVSNNVILVVRRAGIYFCVKNTPRQRQRIAGAHGNLLRLTDRQLRLHDDR